MPASVDLALSAAVGITAAACMSPFILTIDRAVTEFAAGRSSLLVALGKGTTDIVRHPGRVFGSPALAMVVGVYGATYAAANMISTVSEHRQVPKAQHTMINLGGTTAVNMTSGVAKDAAFAKMFGSKLPSSPANPGMKDLAVVAKRAIPRATYGLFAARDLLTVGAAFTVPPIVATAIAANGVRASSIGTLAPFLQASSQRSAERPRQRGCRSSQA